MARLEPGAIVSYTQLLQLVSGISYEGHCSFVSRAEGEKFYHHAQFRRIYEDLLASLVLFGPAKIRIPTYLSQQIDAEILVREGLLDFDNQDTTARLRERIGRTYQLAFQKCREIDGNPATSRLISWEVAQRGRREGRSIEARINAASDLEDFWFYFFQLCELIDPLTRNLGPIFDYYIAHNQVENSILYEIGSQDHYRFIQDASEQGKDRYGDHPKIDDGIIQLLVEMGLHQLNAVELENASGGFPGPFSYSPDDFFNLEEQDTMLLAGSGSFQDYMATGLEFASRRDPNTFIRVQNFWHTYFDILNMLAYSEASGSPLFIPGDAKIGLGVKNSHAATESMIRIYRVFLAESGLLPTPKSLDDALRLRDDPNLNSLRRALATWVQIYPELENDPSLLPEIKAEISAATKAVSRLDGLAKIGSMSGYIALPVGVVEYITGGGIIGLSLAPIAPAIDIYRYHKLKKFGWVKFGK